MNFVNSEFQNSAEALDVFFALYSNQKISAANFLKFVVERLFKLPVWVNMPQKFIGN